MGSGKYLEEQQATSTDRKFYEPIVHEQHETSNRSFKALIKGMPLIGVGK